MTFAADASLFLAEFGEDVPRNGGATVRVIWDEPGGVAFGKLYGNIDDGMVHATKPSVTAVAGTIAAGDTLLRNGVTYQVADLDPHVDGVFVVGTLTRL